MVILLTRQARLTSPSSFSTTGLFVCIGSLWLLLTKPALADTLNPYASAAVAYDDNLFRLSDNTAQELRSGADTYRTTIAGLRIERPIGRQVFSGHADFTSMKFERNRQLDYTSCNASAEWHWFLAAHFEGHIGSAYGLALAPFADFHSQQRNLRADKRHYADGNWRFHPSWRWVTSYAKFQYVYDLPAQRNNDRTDDSMTSGVDYLASSGSTVGLQLRRLKGGFLEGQPFAADGFRQGYIQYEAKLNALWLMTGSTRVTFLGGWVQRKQEAIAGHFESGKNARLIVDWTVTGRFKLAGQAWREFAAVDGTLIDSALATGASAVATWDVSSKFQVEANLRRETRRFTPFSNAGMALSRASSSDSTHTAFMGLTYTPLRGVTLKASAFREGRSGSVAAGTNDYRARGASVTGSVQF